ncbi:MAG TPA: cyclic nucleotide-binding domain-containing protein [Terriglobales bacterium]|nr:cyclic nucleotide-binding domain-containing protein [Terriglobales bacterium]
MAHEQPELLKDLAADEVQKILAFGTKITVPIGGSLFRLGDTAERLFLIERGLIRLTLPMKVRGSEEDVVVEERTSGQTVGWSALIPPYRFTLAATAPLETQVLALPREELRKHLAANPVVGYKIALNLAVIIGHRLQLFQAMWLREMQRMVEKHSA